MPLTINTNVASLEAQSNISLIQEKLRSNFAKLSSGYRINTAADDASGLAISAGLQRSVSGYSVAQRNINAAISITQTIDGTLGQITSIVARLRDIAVQASNGDLTSTDRGYLNTEYSQLKSEVDRVISATKYNNIVIMGAGSSPITYQIGVGTNASQHQITVTNVPITTTGLGFDASTVDTTSNAQNAITALDNAMSVVGTPAGNGINGARAYYGAIINRLNYALANAQSAQMNMAAANSRIIDVDVAEETAQLARNQVLSQAASSVLAQANQAPQLALTLLR